MKRLQIAFSAPFLMTGRPTGGNFRVSPDGHTLVYHALTADSFQLVRRELDSLEVTPIAGTDRAQNMTFSPDGTRLAFYARGAIRTVSVRGGTPTLVCEWTGVAPFIAWTDDGSIWINALGSGIYR